MEFKIIYEDNDVLVVDKPAGIVVFPEGQTTENTLIDYLLSQHPVLAKVGEAPRYGVVHRLDKDTSGILLVAKNNESLIFLQKQFKNRALGLHPNEISKRNEEILSENSELREGLSKIDKPTSNYKFAAKISNSSANSHSDASPLEKKYVCLVEGDIKDDSGRIETLIGRAPGDKRKQKVYLPGDLSSQGKREAITEYKVLERFKDYTLLEVEIKTGRRHQIRCHFSYLQHPIAGDKLYGFKNSKRPQGLTRQFLHAQKIKIQLPNGKTEEFKSELPKELQKVLNNLIKE